MNLSVGDYIELGKSSLIKILRENLSKEPYSPAEKEKLKEWGRHNFKGGKPKKRSLYERQRIPKTE